MSHIENDFARLERKIDALAGFVRETLGEASARTELRVVNLGNAIGRLSAREGVGDPLEAVRTAERRVRQLEEQIVHLERDLARKSRP